MNKLAFATSILFFTLLFLLLAAHIATQPRIMILHSYDLDYSWSRDINKGLEVLQEAGLSYKLRWHYMDTKNFSDPYSLESRGRLARTAIAQFKPDVLIAIDDNAQQYAAKYYVNHPGINIVFAGVNASVEEYGYRQADNVTGIFEFKQLKAVRELIMNIEKTDSEELDAPEKSVRPKLLYLLDGSSSLRKDRSFVDSFSWDPVRFIGSIEAKNFDHWKEIIQYYSKYVDYIMLANYRNLATSISNAKKMNPEEVLRWTEQFSAVPVIGLNRFNVEDGAMLSVGASPLEQGQVAASMARHIIDKNISASQIPFRTNDNYLIALRQELVDKRQLNLPDIYKKFAQLIDNVFE